MVDPQVQNLLEHAIDTPVKLHLLLLFHENVRLEATPTLIANRVCRDIWSVDQALHELAEDGVLQRAPTAHGEVLYRYAPHDELVEPIRRLIRGYDDPMERDSLQRSIRDLASYAPYRRASSWELQRV
jgi:hypothetical protein